MRYNEMTRRYFEAAACGAGPLEGPGVRSGEAGSRVEGAWVRFEVRIEEAPGGPRIRAARFFAFGCPHLIAAAAYVAERAADRAAEPRLPEGIEALRQRFAVPVEKTGRLLILEDAWIAAVKGAAPGAC